MPTCSGGRSCPHHGANSCGEVQSLAHVLNSCQKALSLRRYTTRHDDVLKVIFDFSKRNLKSGMQVIADLPGQQYTFPQDIAPTDLRPDMVIWGTSAIYLVELTVPLRPTLQTLQRGRSIGTGTLQLPVLVPATHLSSLLRSGREAS